LSKQVHRAQQQQQQQQGLDMVQVVYHQGLEAETAAAGEQPLKPSQTAAAAAGVWAQQLAAQQLRPLLQLLQWQQLRARVPLLLLLRHLRSRVLATAATAAAGFCRQLGVWTLSQQIRVLGL
jgi:hypothetical protein